MADWICLIGNSLNSATAIQALGYACHAVLDTRKDVPAAFVQQVALMASASLQDDAAMDAGVERLIQLQGVPRAFISHTEHGYRHVARLSQRYGLPANSPQALAASRDKPAMRALLNDDARQRVDYVAGDAQAIYAQLSQRSMLDVIIKPADGWGSRLVNHVRSAAQLAAWLEHDGPQWPRWIAEEYLPGPEYSVEVICAPSGNLLVGITEKVTSGAPHYYETGHLFPAPSVSASLATLIFERVSQALQRLDIRMGATHTEIRVHPQRGPLLIETHIRPGGDYISELINYATGQDISRLSIASVLGLVLPGRVVASRGAAVYFLTQEPGFCKAVEVTGALQEETVKKWQLDVVPGQLTQLTTDSTNRAGCVLCVAGDAQDAWAQTQAWAGQCRVDYARP